MPCSSIRCSLCDPARACNPSIFWVTTAIDFFRIFQLHDRFVHRIWPRRAKRRPSLKFVVPMLDSSRFRRHEILVIHGLAAGPNAIRPPEIRNSASSRYSGPGKDHYPVRFSNVFDQFLQLGSHSRNSNLGHSTMLSRRRIVQ